MSSNMRELTDGELDSVGGGRTTITTIMIAGPAEAHPAVA